MRISDLHIDGFGIFHNASLSNMGPGLVLFKGNNEAGKSTLLGFIRTILFGFPRANSSEPNYPALAGGVHGGRLSVVSQPGEEFTIERKPGKGGGAVTVYGNDGKIGSNDLLTELLGGVTYEVFKNIYAFSLAELQAIDTLKAESVRNMIYGASAGVAMLALPKAYKRINSRLDELFKSGGSKPVINQNLTKLEKIRSEIREAYKGIDNYDRAFVDLKNTEENIQTYRSDLAIIIQKRDRFRAYSKIWEEWVTLKECEAELEQIKEIVEDFPENGIDALNKLLSSLENHEENRETLESEITNYKGEIEALVIDRALLEQQAVIRLLLEKKNGYKNNCSELPLKKQAKKELDSAISILLRSLGRNWTEEKVISIDRSLFIREKIRKHEDRIGNAEHELAIASRILVDKKNHHENALREETAASEELQRLEPEMQEPEEQVIQHLQHGRDEFAGAIRDIPKRETELQLEQQQLVRLVKEIDPTWTDKDLSNFDQSISARKKVEEFASLIKKAENELWDAERLYQTIEVGLNKTRERLNNALSKLEAANKLAFVSRKELEQRKSFIQLLEQNLLESAKLSNEVKHQGERLSDKQEELKRLTYVPGKTGLNFIKWTAFGLQILGTMGFGLLPFLGRFINTKINFFDMWIFCGIPFAISFSLLIIYKIIVRHKEKKYEIYLSIINPINAEISKIEDDLDEKERNLRNINAKISELSDYFKMSGRFTNEEIITLKDQLNAFRLALDDRDRIAQDVKSLEDEVKNVQEELNVAEERIDASKNSLTSIRAEWKEHLKKIGLSSGFTPELTVTIFSKVEIGLQQLGSMKKLMSRIREMESAVQKYKTVAESVPLLRESCGGSGEELLTAVDRFFLKLQEERKRQEFRRVAQQRFSEKKKVRIEAQEALAQAEKEHERVGGLKSEALDSWYRWLSMIGLPVDLSPKTALEVLLIAAIEPLRGRRNRATL